MNDEQLQKTAYLYGRNVEKLQRTETDKDRYEEYQDLCVSLWLELKENDATDGVKLKPEYIASFTAGRDSGGNTSHGTQ